MARDPKPSAAERRHYKLVERTVDVALAAAPIPLRVLDVDCGEGDYLRELIVRVPHGTEYIGVDSSDDSLRVARADPDIRLNYLRAQPDALPFPDAHFDLVISGMGFRQWARQADALAQLARVGQHARQLGQRVRLTGPLAKAHPGDHQVEMRVWKGQRLRLGAQVVEPDVGIGAGHAK